MLRKRKMLSDDEVLIAVSHFFLSRGLSLCRWMNGRIVCKHTKSHQFPKRRSVNTKKCIKKIIQFVAINLFTITLKEIRVEKYAEFTHVNVK